MRGLHITRIKVGLVRASPLSVIFDVREGDAFLIYSSFQGLMSQGSGVRNCRSRF